MLLVHLFKQLLYKLHKNLVKKYSESTCYSHPSPACPPRRQSLLSRSLHWRRQEGGLGVAPWERWEGEEAATGDVVVLVGFRWAGPPFQLPRRTPWTWARRTAHAYSLYSLCSFLHVVLGLTKTFLILITINFKTCIYWQNKIYCI
jgi:hypothetical protein